MFQRILVPLDGSTASFNALSWALQIAICEEATITALCVIDVRLSQEARVYLPLANAIGVSDEFDPPTKVGSAYEEWAQQIVAEAQTQGKAVGVKVQPDITTGLPYEEIVSRSWHHELLVLGAWETAHAFPGPFLAGSTLWRVVSRTRLPTLAVSLPLQKIETILVAYDGSPTAQDALQLAATWAQVWDLTLIVLALSQSGQQAQTLSRQVRQRVQPLVPRLVSRDGTPENAIAQVAEHYRCDLVALGVNHSLLSHSLGHVPDTLLRVGDHPLLLSH